MTNSTATSTLNKAQSISVVVAPMVSGLVSSLASLAIIVSILRSDLKLSTIYRRLVFGISVYDLIQSIAQSFSSVPSPVGSFWLSFGNALTCTVQGFGSVLGCMGAGFYTLSLTIYFLLVVRYNLDEAKIKKYAEPYLHAVPIVYSSVLPVVYVFTNSYSSDGGPMCVVTSTPPDCRNDQNEECTFTVYMRVLQWLSGGAILVVFVLNCIILVMIVLTVYFLTKRRSSHQEQVQGSGSYSNSRSQKSSIHRTKELSRRAIAYIAGSLFVYTFSAIYHIHNHHSNSPAPFLIMFLERLTFPLQGLFNVLIYTYPHVASYQRNKSECSWPRAFWEVVKNGGDSDCDRKLLVKEENVIHVGTFACSEECNRKDSPLSAEHIETSSDLFPIAPSNLTNLDDDDCFNRSL